MQILIDRLLAKTRRTSGCWLWTGYSKNGRYGTIYVDGKSKQAHVAMYELRTGVLRPGYVVMHSCDSPRCVNPKHLIAGTQKQNMADCVAKGRFRKPARYKLTEPGAVEGIYRMLDSGMSQRQVAALTGVTQTMICVLNKQRSER